MVDLFQYSSKRFLPRGISWNRTRGPSLRCNLS